MRSGKATHAVMRFVVEGKGNFPFEMLSYEGAVFYSSADLHAAQQSGMAFAHRVRRIQMRRFYIAEGTHAPTRTQWEERGWKVVEIDGEAAT